ncbi:hypothetical protein [Streptomyces sp. GS7]|nr:hypothetical protein [Streptomyces sp. GS7]
MTAGGGAAGTAAEGIPALAGLPQAASVLYAERERPGAGAPA